MIFVDTGYFIALTSPRDSLHARAQAWAKAGCERLITTEYVIWEVVNSYSMPADRPKAYAIVASIRSGSDCEIVSATADLFERGLELHRTRPDKEWSLTDCISFLVMEERKATLALTPDHHFEQAGFKALLRREPG